ncbi:MAG: hypothetical protein PVH45_03225 [Candidatus Omnitrophota bacterium]
MISFSGVDGSGKSTLAERTFEYLRGKGIDAVKLEVYAGSTFLSIGRAIGRLSRGFKENLESKVSRAKRNANPLVKWARVFCFRIDVARFKKKSRALERKGVLPVCDRYLYDTLVHLKYLKVIGDKEYDKLFKAIPRPEVSFLLHLDSASAKDREGQHDSVDYYAEKVKLYEGLAGKTDLVEIDSSPGRDVVWENVKNVIDSKFI